MRGEESKSWEDHRDGVRRKSEGRRGPLNRDDINRQTRGWE